MWVPRWSENTHLNPHAPVFKPTEGRYSRRGDQAEKLIHYERSQPQDGHNITREYGQTEELQHVEDMQEQEMSRSS